MALLPHSQSDQTISVGKLEAAKRQLRTAIKLWFMEDDPVSIHTLVSAAHELIHTLFKNKGLRGMLFDNDIIKDEHRGEFAKFVKSSATFFKHARKDADAVIEFNPLRNYMLLLATTLGLRKIDKTPIGLPEEAFLLWLGIHRPDISGVGKLLEEQLPVEFMENLRATSRRDFFQMFERIKQQTTR
jgi:hypothetical protein